jgi:hypothetical protein
VLKVAFPVVAFAGYRIAQYFKNSRAKDWQPTPGVVFKIETIYKDGIWNAQLYYSYSWEGEYYSGCTVQQFATERGVDAFAQKFPKDMSVTVRVNVDDPQNSALILDEQFVRA